jgi:hypothetical protein
VNDAKACPIQRHVAATWIHRLSCTLPGNSYPLLYLPHPPICMIHVARIYNSPVGTWQPPKEALFANRRQSNL